MTVWLCGPLTVGIDTALWGEGDVGIEGHVWGAGHIRGRALLQWEKASDHLSPRLKPLQKQPPPTPFCDRLNLPHQPLSNGQ